MIVDTRHRPPAVRRPRTLDTFDVVPLLRRLDWLLLFAVALLGTCAKTGALTWNRARLVRYLTITVALTIVVIGGSRLLFGRAMHQEYSKDKVLAGMLLLHQPVRAVVH